MGFSSRASKLRRWRSTLPALAMSPPIRKASAPAFSSCDVNRSIPAASRKSRWMSVAQASFIALMLQREMKRRLVQILPGWKLPVSRPFPSPALTFLRDHAVDRLPDDELPALGRLDLDRRILVGRARLRLVAVEIVDLQPLHLAFRGIAEEIVADRDLQRVALQLRGDPVRHVPLAARRRERGVVLAAARFDERQQVQDLVLREV